MAAVRPAPADRPGRAAPAAPPGRYVPLRHPGVPRRWSRDAILHALQAWAARTGAAPRRLDWSGEQPERATRAQRLWMAEHPDWPSSSCVAAHFGSWSAGLAAAGLRARPLTFGTSVAERVDAARRMAAAGRSLREIADQLDVSVSSVSNYLRARRCPECGGPVTSPRATRCAGCTAHEPTIARVWTRESVSAAVQAWQAEHGRAPTYHEWTPSRTRPGRWEAESPRWPSAAVVTDIYGNWNAALIDARAGVQLRRWSDDAIRAALATFWTRTGRPPTSADVADPGWPGPCVQTLRRRFGGLAEAWQRLGPVPRD